MSPVPAQLHGHGSANGGRIRSGGHHDLGLDDERAQRSPWGGYAPNPRRPDTITRNAPARTPGSHARPRRPRLGAAPGRRPVRPAVGPKGTSLNKVLVIGTDGTRWDLVDAAIKAGRAPNLARLRAAGFGAAVAAPVRPRHVHAQRGRLVLDRQRGLGEQARRQRHQAEHGPRPGHEERLPRLPHADREHAPETSTFLASDWDNIGLAENGGPIFGSAMDANYAARVTVETLAAWDQGDEQVTTAASRYLRRGNPDAGFVYLGVVDESAHLAGSATPTYANAIATTDGRIGRILAAIRARPSYPFETLDDHRHDRPRTEAPNRAVDRQPLRRHSARAHVVPLRIGPRAHERGHPAARGGHPPHRSASTRPEHSRELEHRRALAQQRASPVVRLRQAAGPQAAARSAQVRRAPQRRQIGGAAPPGGRLISYGPAQWPPSQVPSRATHSRDPARQAPPPVAVGRSPLAVGAPRWTLRARERSRAGAGAGHASASVTR